MMAFAWIHLISLFDESSSHRSCVAHSAHSYIPMWLEKCTRILTAVAAQSIFEHHQISLEIFSITADKCNICQDFLHTNTDTVPAAKHFFTSSSPPLPVFTSVTNHCSQICESSVADHTGLVAANVRWCPIEQWPRSPESQPHSQHRFEETAKKLKIQPWCDWRSSSILSFCCGLKQLHPQ